MRFLWVLFENLNQNKQNYFKTHHHRIVTNPPTAASHGRWDDEEDEDGEKRERNYLSNDNRSRTDDHDLLQIGSFLAVLGIVPGSELFSSSRNRIDRLKTTTALLLLRFR